MDLNSRYLQEDSRETRSFNASHGLYMLFWMFLLGSILGFVLEGLWSLVYWGKWARHAGVVWGPFCQIYGLGLVAMYIAVSMMPMRSMPLWKILLSQFMVCAVAGSLVEYLVSLFQEIGFGSISWDYSDQKWNIGGRISVGMTFVWGAAGLVCIYGICPLMRRCIKKIQGHGGYVVTWAMIVFMCINLAVSAAAIGRWHERSESIPPRTSLGTMLDEKFDDERMENLFPNMQFCAPGTYSYADHAA